MISCIAISKDTIQLGELISPVESKLVYNIIEKILAIIYFTMLIAMTSAGGSLLNQIFGLPQWVGGAIITALTLQTVLGSFTRMSIIFKKFVPILFSTCVLAIIIVLLTQNKVSESNLLINHNSSISWQRSSMLFLSYNCMGMLTVAKKKILLIGAIIAFVAGLTDFKKIVAILYPAQGYIGCIILTLVLVNFSKIIINKLKNLNCG